MNFIVYIEEFVRENAQQMGDLNTISAGFISMKELSRCQCVVFSDFFYLDEKLSKVHCFKRLSYSYFFEFLIKSEHKRQTLLALLLV
jgi:hypothetical protein